MEKALLGADVFFILIGAILVFAMHGGFAFLEAGTVRHKNQVNALVKILCDFAISVLAYFSIGYLIAYGLHFFDTAATLNEMSGLGLVKFFFLATFAAAVPAIISGGIAERAKFSSQLIAGGIIVALIYPFLEGMVWNSNYGLQSWFESALGAGFHDFAGSIVVHAMGGFIALGAVLVLGPRIGRYRADGKVVAMPPSNILWLALGSWLLCIGWFGFNVMTAGSLGAISGLVAINSLMAMVGGIVGGLVAGKNDPGFVHNGALAGLVAVCAGSDVMHPIGALVVGLIAGVLFVYLFLTCQNRWRIDDVLGVFPLHGVAGLWGGIACGIFGQTALGGLGGVTFASQLVGSVLIALYALAAGLILYGILKATLGIRLSEDEELIGADVAVHKVGSTPEADAGRASL